MRDGDDFDAFYASTAARLTRNIYLSTGDLGRAQDCVQEAYLRAWQHWGELGGSGDDPVAWVRTVAWRLAVKDWRRGVRQASAYVRHGAETDAPPPSADVVAVRDALATLPTSQRASLILHYFDDLSVRQVAHTLGVPEGTVKARLSRGRAALAEALDADEEDRSWVTHV